jgi:hypothetical protein
MVIDAADNVANLGALDTPPFPIDLRRAMCTEPAVGAIPDDDTTARYANTIAAIDHVLAIHATSSSLEPKPTSILRPAKRAKTIEFDRSCANDGSIVTVGSAIDPQAIDDTDVSHFYEIPASA